MADKTGRKPMPPVKTPPAGKVKNPRLRKGKSGY